MRFATTITTKLILLIFLLLVVSLWFSYRVENEIEK